MLLSLVADAVAAVQCHWAAGGGKGQGASRPVLYLTFRSGPEASGKVEVFST
jgi:hypothetical protein